MNQKDTIILLNSEKPLFSDLLAYDLEERKYLINKHKDEQNYICNMVNQYYNDVTHILNNSMPASMISNLTYNLVHNLASCCVGLTIYNYLQTAYLIDEDYDTNYELWKNFSLCARKIEKMVSNLTDANIFNIDEPSACENLLLSADSEKRVPISLLRLQHTLSKINGESLFVALLDKIRYIESSLKTLKLGIYNLTDEDFETIYNANYTLYVENYWSSEGKYFRHHIEDNYFNRGESEIDILSNLLRDEKYDFERTKTGSLWRDYFHDKKKLYFEMRMAKIDEKQWKYFFKEICRFEEYEKWIEELKTPKKPILGLKAFVVKPEIANVVVAKITSYVNKENKPKPIVRPIRAAMDSGVMYRPSWDAFVEDFGSNKISSKTSFNDYTNPEKTPYYGASYDTLVDEFKKFIE